MKCQKIRRTAHTVLMYRIYICTSYYLSYIQYMMSDTIPPHSSKLRCRPEPGIDTLVFVQSSQFLLWEYHCLLLVWSFQRELFIRSSNHPAQSKFWMLSPESLEKAFVAGSQGLSDKTTAHKYQHMYHRYLGPFLGPLILRTCLSANHTRLLRMLETGLGCSPRGGIINGTPGGSALAWRYMF